MFEPRLRFLASDEDFDDFAFEDETVDLEVEIGEYQFDDHEDELDSVSPVIVFIPPPRVVIASQALSIESTELASVVRKKPASVRSISDKRQTRKSLSTPNRATSKPIAKKAVAKTERKISSKQRMKDAAKKAIKKAVKKAAKKAVVKTPAKKAPVKKAPAKKAPKKQAPVKKTPGKKAPGKKAPAKKTSAKTKKSPAKKATKKAAKKK